MSIGNPWAQSCNQWEKTAIPSNIDCKFKNVIYLWLCKLCMQNEAYFGRTMHECHDLTCSHRSCFSESKMEKPALSVHAKDMHQNQFSLDNFSVSLAKEGFPTAVQKRRIWLYWQVQSYFIWNESVESLRNFEFYYRNSSSVF